MKNYVKIDDVKAGDILISAYDFGCIPEGKECKVWGPLDNLYVICSHGDHNLDGQIGFTADDCDKFVGFYKKEA